MMWSHKQVNEWSGGYKLQPLKYKAGAQICCLNRFHLTGRTRHLRSARNSAVRIGTQRASDMKVNKGETKIEEFLKHCNHCCLNRRDKSNFKQSLTDVEVRLRSKICLFLFKRKHCYFYAHELIPTRQKKKMIIKCQSQFFPNIFSFP